jgi:spermidine/putrescine transport system substrate-binding protein
MKFRQFILSTVFVLALVASGTLGPVVARDNSGPAASSPAQEVEELQVFNWSEYIDPEIYELFEEETGIRIVESNYASNAEMLAKIMGGGADYDLIVPSDYTVAIMIELDLLAELNHENIPNLENLRPEMREVPYDEGNVHCVPYQWGTTGLGYLASDMEEPTSWSILFEPDEEADYYGRATMLDDSREAMAAALVYLGYSINTTDEAELEEAKQMLINARGAIYAYDSDQFEDLLASGESLLAHGWNGDFLVAQEDNEEVAYTIPEEGGVIWIDNMCILNTISEERKAAAEMFIDFLLRPEIGAMLSDYNYYASPNAAAEELLDEEFLTDPAVYPPAELMEKLQYIEPLGEFESVYERIWDEVKASD